MSLLDDLEEDLARRRSKRGRPKSSRCRTCGSTVELMRGGLCRYCNDDYRKANYGPDYRAVVAWNASARHYHLQGRISTTLWLDLKAAYGGRCAYCGIEGVQLSPDHYWPLSWASTDRLEAKLVTGWITNCRPACQMCNMAKRDNHPADFMAWLTYIRRSDYVYREPNWQTLADDQEATEEGQELVGQEDDQADVHPGEEGQPTPTSIANSLLERLRSETQTTYGAKRSAALNLFTLLAGKEVR